MKGDAWKNWPLLWLAALGLWLPVDGPPSFASGCLLLISSSWEIIFPLLTMNLTAHLSEGWSKALFFFNNCDASIPKHPFYNSSRWDPVTWGELRHWKRTRETTGWYSAFHPSWPSPVCTCYSESRPASGPLRPSGLLLLLCLFRKNILDCRKQMYPFWGRKGAFCSSLPCQTKKDCVWLDADCCCCHLQYLCINTAHSPLLLCPEAGSKGPLLLSRCAHKCPAWDLADGQCSTKRYWNFPSLPGGAISLCSLWWVCDSLWEMVPVAPSFERGRFGWFSLSSQSLLLQCQQKHHMHCVSWIDV